SLAGGALGLLLARWGTVAFGMATENVGKPYWIDFSMNYIVFAYCAGVCVLAGILFGLAPAFQASRVDLNDTLKEGSRSGSGIRRGFFAGALFVFQSPLAVVLRAGAGLMMRSFLKHQARDANVPPQNILLGTLGLPNPRYPKPADRLQFVDRLMP